MDQAGEIGSRVVEDEPIPCRDWLLLPIVGLLTIVLIVVSAEFTARRLFAKHVTNFHECASFADPLNGVRGIPNTSCFEKRAEMPEIVEYRFNSCGHRAGIECGPKPSGTYRIVLIGSSFAMGSTVQREQSYAALLPEELSHATGRKIDLYNEAMGFGFPVRGVAAHFNEALAASPDMILWTVTPRDIDNPDLDLQEQEYLKGSQSVAPLPHQPAGRLHQVVARLKGALVAPWMHRGMNELVSQTGTTLLMIRHSLYQSQSEYVKLYLLQGDDAGFLRVNPSPKWKDHERSFDQYTAEMAEQAKAASIPFVVALVPNRAEAAMISMGEWPAGYNPYKLGDDIRDVTQQHGGIYVDILPEFKTIPNPEQYYMPIDGHPTVQGYSLISEILSKDLSGGVMKSLYENSETKFMPERGK